jgi:hypothetical protein
MTRKYHYRISVSGLYKKYEKEEEVMKAENYVMLCKP